MLDFVKKFYKECLAFFILTGWLLLNLQTFIKYQSSSDGLVLRSLFFSAENLYENETPFLTAGNQKVDLRTLRNPEKVNALKCDSIGNVYPAQYCLHMILYKHLYKSVFLLTGKHFPAALCIYLLNLSFNIIALILLVLLANKTISGISGRSIFWTAIPCFFSTYVVGMLKSIYWCAWSWLIPLIITWYYYGTIERKRSWAYVFLYWFSLTAAFCVKCLLGYEFYTTIVLMAATPIVYHFIVHKNYKKTLLHVGGLCSSSVLAFLVAMFLHLNKLSHYLGTWKGAIDAVYLKILKRGGTVDAFNKVLSEHPEIQSLKESIQATDLEVLSTYLFKGSLLPVPFVSFGVILLLAGIIFAVQRKHKSLLCLALIMCVGPVSWHILMTAHSYIHTHINYILWFMPCVPILYYYYYCCVVDWFPPKDETVQI